MIFTRDIVAFAHMDEDTLVDAIPSSEITGIFDMSQNVVPSRNGSARLNRKEQTVETISHIDVAEHLGFGQMNTSTNILQIQTMVDGYNSGRTYHLRTSSQEECTSLVDALSKKSKLARKMAEARTRFEKYQQKVGLVVTSTAYQCFIAFLIAVVPSPPFPRRSHPLAPRRRIARSRRSPCPGRAAKPRARALTRRRRRRGRTSWPTWRRCSSTGSCGRTTGA
jgi:hypothetical protein